MRKPDLPPDISEIIRARLKDLDEARKNDAFNELVRRCEAEYWPWELLRFRADAKKIDSRLVWLVSRFSRESRSKSLPLYGHGKKCLKYNTPDILQRELMLIDQQLAGGLTSEEDSLPSASQRERFIVSALQEEAIASSMLEGAVTTRREAKEMLEAGRKPRNRGEIMVKNNYQAIQFIRQHRKVDLSPEFLLELQKILTEKTLDKADQVGRFRTADDNITVVDSRDNEVVHVPPPASELTKRLKMLCDFANTTLERKEFIHPVIAACVLHFQLGFDHPFCDGNGRTARAVFYWMMLRSGYWLFEYLPISRLIYKAPIKYSRAYLYCETDQFDVTYFLMYKARIIEVARHELAKYIVKKQTQLAQARKLFSSDRRLNYRQQEIVLHAARNPDRRFTISEHQNKYAVAYGTARSDFLRLVRWRFMEKIQIGKRFEFSAGQKLTELA